METKCSLANAWQAKVSTGSARLGLPTEQVLPVLVGATALGVLTRRGFFGVPSPGRTTKPDFVGVPALSRSTKPGVVGCWEGVLSPLPRGRERHHAVCLASNRAGPVGVAK